MQGYLSILLHAHLPFVRHPEHEKFLEESWLFEAVAETYLPLLQILEGWRRDGVEAPLTLSLSPTLCAMLSDGLLRERCDGYLNGLVELAEKEIHRTHWDRPFHDLACWYHQRFTALRETWQVCGRDLVGAFGRFQDQGGLEIITTAATHALLPLLAPHPPSLRAQILTARDEYRRWFGRPPRGLWLPECAYVEDLEPFLREADLRWFVIETHGLLYARPRPRFATFAPVFTPNGLAAFGRDPESARQVWSRQEGYPGDTRYRDFYRDVGFDLDFDYVRPHLPSPETRGFTGLKYYRIGHGPGGKDIYRRQAALQAAAEHAGHFLRERLAQARKAGALLGRAPLVVAPYDAELFGHWWYEGPEFLDYLARKLFYDQKSLTLITPSQYLNRHPTHQIATPAASSWGEAGYWHSWLNETNEWIYPHLDQAQTRMTALARRFGAAGALPERALRQAARELLLAQASDWPFLLRAGSSADYARRRVKDHLLRFLALERQLHGGALDESWLQEVEARDNLFADVNGTYWQ